VRELRLYADTETQVQLAFWYERVRATREIITCANLALVLTMGKRMRNSYVDFDELVSEGNMALLRAVEKFDVSRGFKFSTYACRAIVQSFSRLGLKSRRYHRTFATEFASHMEDSVHQQNAHLEVESDAAYALLQIIRENKAKLSLVEKKVILGRFAINRCESGSELTLEELGQFIGLTRERVRQIQENALAKLRTTMERLKW
jgi:RNA polymerase primary sigma factor